MLLGEEELHFDEDDNVLATRNSRISPGNASIQMKHSGVRVVYNATKPDRLAYTCSRSESKYFGVE